MRLTPEEEIEFQVLEVLCFVGYISDQDYKRHIELHKKRHMKMYVIFFEKNNQVTVVVTTDPLTNYPFITSEIVKQVDTTGRYEGDKWGMTKEGTWTN